MNRPRASLLASLVCSAVLLAAGTAAAQGQSGPGNRPGDERLPSGQVQVWGAGTVAIAGRLTVSGNLPARARVRVIDREGDAKVYIAGDPVPLRGGRAAVLRAGILYVSGSDLTLQVTGRGIELSAAGLGRVAMRGAGRFRLNLGPERPWLRAPLRLVPARPRAQRVARARVAER